MIMTQKMTPPRRPAAAAPTGGAACGPAEPDPRRLLGVGHLFQGASFASGWPSALPDPRRLLGVAVGIRINFMRLGRAVEN